MMVKLREAQYCNLKFFLIFLEIAFIYEKTESWARVTYFRAKQRIAQEVLK